LEERLANMNLLCFKHQGRGLLGDETVPAPQDLRSLSKHTEENDSSRKGSQKQNTLGGKKKLGENRKLDGKAFLLGEIPETGRDIRKDGQINETALGGQTI